MNKNRTKTLLLAPVGEFVKKKRKEKEFLES